MKPRFHYLHGFNSGPDRTSDKVRLLESLGDVILLGYDSLDTYDHVMKGLIASVDRDSDGDPVFIGNSLGGFYAAELGKHFCRPSVLINPAWRPLDVLEPLCGKTFTNFKTGSIRVLEKDAVESYRDKGFAENRDYRPLVLLDEADDLLDSRKASDYFTGIGCPVVLFEGGSHRFEHMEQALPHISSYVNICEYVTDLDD